MVIKVNSAFEQTIVTFFKHDILSVAGVKVLAWVNQFTILLGGPGGNNVQ